MSDWGTRRLSRRLYVFGAVRVYVYPAFKSTEIGLGMAGLLLFSEVCPWEASSFLEGVPAQTLCGHLLYSFLCISIDE